MPVEELGQVLEACIAGLRRYAIALVRNPEDADDLVQECLAKALARAHVWHEIRNPRAYLFSTLHNVYVDRRRQGHRTENQVALELTDQSHLANSATQDGHLEIRDLARGLTQLSEEQRQVVLLVGLEGMSYQEVSDVLGIPVGTVMSRLFRGRKALREFMAGDGRSYLRRVV